MFINFDIKIDEVPLMIAENSKNFSNINFTEINMASFIKIFTENDLCYSSI